jgi:hypothetical protein
MAGTDQRTSLTFAQVGKGELAASLALEEFRLDHKTLADRVCKNATLPELAEACKKVVFIPTDTLKSLYIAHVHFSSATSRGMRAADRQAVTSVSAIWSAFKRLTAVLDKRGGALKQNLVAITQELLAGLRAGNVAIFSDVGRAGRSFIAWFRAAKSRSGKRPGPFDLMREVGTAGDRAVSVERAAQFEPAAHSPGAARVLPATDPHQHILHRAAVCQVCQRRHLASLHGLRVRAVPGGRRRAARAAELVHQERQRTAGVP